MMSDFKDVYTKSFKTIKHMNLAESLILEKLDFYKEKANGDRFVLPVEKDINFFTDIFDQTHAFFS